MWYGCKTELGSCPDIDSGGHAWAAQQGSLDSTPTYLRILSFFPFLIILVVVLASHFLPHSHFKETACPIYAFPMGPSFMTYILKFAISDTIPLIFLTLTGIIEIVGQCCWPFCG